MKLTMKKKKFTIPYIPAISYRFKNITKDFKANLVFFSLNKLRYIVKGHKDILPKSSQKNVVYKLSCKDCNAMDVTSDRHVGKWKLALMNIRIIFVEKPPLNR